MSTRKQQLANLLQGATRANDNGPHAAVYNFYGPVTVNISEGRAPVCRRNRLFGQNFMSSAAVRRALANVPPARR